MKKYMVRLILSLCVVMPLGVFGQTLTSVSLETALNHRSGVIPIDDIMASYMKNHQVPGAVVVIYQAGVPHTYYYGYANLAKKQRVTDKTIFELGSISKIMTSLLLAQEVDMANIQLASPITTLLPQLPDNFQNISLQSLATHTAGLPFAPQQDARTMEALVKVLKEIAIPADSSWRYSNLGIGLLGQGLASISKKSFYDLYRRHILNALGMESLITARGKLKKKLQTAQGYDQEGKVIEPIVDDVYTPAAGLKASAKDMQKFLAAAIGLPNTPPRVLYPMRMTQSIYVKLSDPDYQGLGWEIHSLDKLSIEQLPVLSPLARSEKSVEIEERPYFDSKALIDKTGGTRGFRAYIALVPHEKSGVVILTNKFIQQAEIVNVGRRILSQIIQNKEVAEVEK